MEPARTTAPSPQPAGGEEDAEPPVPAAPSSFAELLRLVRSGRSPPGVRSPRAAPTGDTPTASSLPRPKKPWETSAQNEDPPPTFLVGALILLDFHIPYLNS
uniref:Peroxisomal membrane protein PEX14-like KPWE domain-containing protein n=1 Tax=Cairina moschata TaxID=8855 RepID=A0A8C3C9Z6_CAIMO